MTLFFIYTALLTGIVMIPVILYFKMVREAWFAVPITLLIGWCLSAIFIPNTSYREYRNYYVVSMEHQEEWTTKESRQVKVHDGWDEHRNRDGSVSRTERYHYRTEYYTEHHGPFWNATLNNNDEIPMDSDYYAKWMTIWGTERKTGEHVGSCAGLSGGLFGIGETAKTGGIFSCSWPHSTETVFPWAITATYKNKVRASDASVFKYKQPTPELVKQYPRPVDNADYGPIYNIDAVTRVTGMDQLAVARTNALQGMPNQVHSMFLLFDASRHTQSVVEDVFSAWEGPNKNELVTFIGIDSTSGVASWVKTESWCDNTQIHLEMEQALLGKKFTGELAAVSLTELVPKYWHRKRFRDFNYLSIPMHGGAYITYLICLIIGTVGMWFFDKDYRSPCG